MLGEPGSPRVAIVIAAVAAAKAAHRGDRVAAARRAKDVVSLTAVASRSRPCFFRTTRSSIDCANFAFKADFNGLSAHSVYNEKKQSSDSAGTDG